MVWSNYIARACGFGFIVFALLILPSCGGGPASSGSPGNSGGSGQPFAEVKLEPPSVSMSRGNQRSSTLTAQVGGGFSGSLALSATGAPAGVAVSFEPQTIAGSGSSNVTVTVPPGTPTGTYSITITGSGNAAQDTTTLTLVVTAAVLLTWNPSPSGDVVGYNLARSTNPGGGYAQLNSTVISGTTYVDETAESGHTYYYIARAVNSSGFESTPSNEASAEVP